MKIIPAIDLYNGKCVRLLKGEFENRTEYFDDPLQCAYGFSQEGAKEIHIVDLEGAESGEPKQLETILTIKKNTSLRVQAGGGFRNQETIRCVLEHKVDRVVIGSLAVSNPELIKSLIIEYGVERFVLAFDVFSQEQPKIAIKGWSESTAFSLWDMLNEYSAFAKLRILCTDINRDGMLIGPNINLYQECITRYPNFYFQASGGVSSLQDLYELKRVGVSSVIIGKALYANYFSLSQAFDEMALC